MTTTEEARTPGQEEAVTILYTNYRGETAVRRITPIAREWFGSSDWHPEPQWLFTAFDMDKEAFRDFARSGVKAWGQAAVDAVLAPAPSSPGVPDSVRALFERLVAMSTAWAIYSDERGLASGLMLEAAKLISTQPAGQAGDAGADDRTDEWRRGALEAAEICRSYAATARGPSPFDDETTAEHRALAYETAAEAIERRMAEGQKLRAESCAADRSRVWSKDLGWNRKLAAWLVWFAEQQFASTHDYSARNRLRWAAEALIGADGVAALGKPTPDSTRTGAAETEEKARRIVHRLIDRHFERTSANSDAATEAAIRDLAALAARPEAPSDAGWRDALEAFVAREWPEGRLAGAAARELVRALGARALAPTLQRLLTDLLGQINFASTDRSQILADFANAAPEAARTAKLDSFERWNPRVFDFTPPSDPAPSGQAEG